MPTQTEYDDWLDSVVDEDDEESRPNWRTKFAFKANTPIIRYIQVRTTPELARAMSRAAAERGITRTQFIRDAIAAAMIASLPGDWTYERVMEHMPGTASKGLPETTQPGRRKGETP